MGKLDRRLVGDTYKVAYELGIVEPPPIVIFHSPEIAKEVERAVAIDVERIKAENILKEALKTERHDVGVAMIRKGMKKTSGQKQ